MKSTSAQTWDPLTYERSARFVSDLGANALALLDARAGERILDLGCGDGALMQTLANTGAAVVGVDTAPAFVEAARARGLDVRLESGEALSFEGEFDAVFSNAALHWMRATGAVVTGVHRALVPGGRFVGEFGGHGNVGAIRTALAAVLAGYGIDAHTVSPWYFPTADAYRLGLQAAGFTVDAIELHARPTLLPGDLNDWLFVFAQSFVAPLAAGERAAVFAATTELLRPVLFDGERWTADYVRLRFAAHRGGFGEAETRQIHGT